MAQNLRLRAQISTSGYRNDKRLGVSTLRAKKFSMIPISSSMGNGYLLGHCPSHHLIPSCTNLVALGTPDHLILCD